MTKIRIFSLIACAAVSLSALPLLAQGPSQSWHNFSGAGWHQPSSAGWHHAGGFGPGNLGLVVRQTDDVHRQVGGLLDQLRGMQGTQVVTSTPFQTLNDNFYERIGMNFGFSLRGDSRIVGLDAFGNPTANGNIDFNQGGFNSAIPQFGGFDAAAQANTGFAITKGGNSAFFNFTAGQGSDRSNVTQAPIVTMMDGQFASVADTSQRPFVTSVIPVVGGRMNAPTFGPAMMIPQTVTNPTHTAIQRMRQDEAMRMGAARATDEGAAARALALRNQVTAPEDKVAIGLAVSRGSSAGHGDLSVAEIKRRKAELDALENQAEQQALLATIEQAKGAEAEGKFGAARVYYQQAARQATGELQLELVNKLKELKGK